jgi:hypothetical protein
VKSSALPEFWKCLEQLPPKIQQTARKNFILWQKDPTLPSLHFKKVKPDLWSVRINAGCRALATYEDGGYIWFWIGMHDEYERLVRHF